MAFIEDDSLEGVIKQIFFILSCIVSVQIGFILTTQCRISDKDYLIIFQVYFSPIFGKRVVFQHFHSFPTVFFHLSFPLVKHCHWQNNQVNSYEVLVSQ